MDSYTLYMRDCKTPVTTVELPPFNPKPDVINWGSRCFVQKQLDGFGKTIYAEATAAWAPVKQ